MLLRLQHLVFSESEAVEWGRSLGRFTDNSDSPCSHGRFSGVPAAAKSCGDGQKRQEGYCVEKHIK